jgi:hypothetical protein
VIGTVVDTDIDTVEAAVIAEDDDTAVAVTTATTDMIGTTSDLSMVLREDHLPCKWTTWASGT